MSKVLPLRMMTLAAVTILLIACTLEPTYQRPNLPVQPTWPDGAPLREKASAVTAADIGWRDFFSDPALQQLIEIALINNRDARIAAINVRAAREQYRIQRADLFPSINATAAESAQRIPAGVISQLDGGAGVPSGGKDGIDIRTYSAGIGFASYEIDLFGRIRSLNHQKLEQYFSYAETQRTAQISLIAEVANAWLTILADQERLRLTQDTLKNQQDSYDLTKLGYDGGVQTALTLRQAETSVDAAKVNLAQYTRALAQDENALALLLGMPIPKSLPTGAGINEVKLIESLPEGLPSDVLLHRPDVLSAEHNLVAANANIGAARAAFFPSISLTGNVGTASSELSGLFKSGSRTWSFAPQINLPIFAGGSNLANLRLSKAQKDLYVAEYEKTIQTAFREVADSLAGRSTLNDQLAAQSHLKDASKDAYRLSLMRFDTGVDSYLVVLDSQRSLYSSQQELVNVKLARLQNLVTLYKALGGGWIERTVTDIDKHRADREFLK